MRKVGTIISRVLYPFLFLFCTWLFLFSEETNNIVNLIFVFVFFGLMIMFFPSVYGFNEKKHGEKTFIIGAIIASIAFIIPIIASSVYLIIIAYNKLKAMAVITGLLLGLSVFSFFITFFKLRSILNEQNVKDNIAQSIASSRIITLFLWSTTSICLIVLTILLAFSSFSTFLDKDFIHVFGKWCVSTKLMISLGIMPWGFVSLYSFIKLYSDFHFLIYDKENYLLFLRSFRFDNKEYTLNLTLKEFGLPVLKIGNPKTFFPKGVGDVFYLPSSNWKKQLDYYISHAKYIFSVVDATEGVLWEMFKHLDSIEKFVYYISDKATLHKFLMENESGEYSNTSLMYCFKKILSDNSIEQCAFCIREGVCYYSDEITIIHFVVKHEKTDTIKSFTIDFQNFIIPIAKSEDKYKEQYNSIDKLRELSRIMKRLFKHNLSITGFILRLVFFVFIIVSSLGLITMGLLLLFNCSMVSDMVSEGERIPEGIFGVLLGGYLLYTFLIKKK